MLWGYCCVYGLILISVLLAVPVPMEGLANVIMDKCVTKDQKPVLKHRIGEAICNGSNCTGNYRAFFNQSGCYYVCIIDIQHLTNSFESNPTLEFGIAESAVLKTLQFTSDNVCPTPDPRDNPALDPHKQFSTTQDNTTIMEDREHSTGMPHWLVVLVVLAVFAIFACFVIGIVLKFRYPTIWNNICCQCWACRHRAQEMVQDGQELNRLNNYNVETGCQLDENID
ncbi:uncharacterized protein LOC125487946 [Rhincodon typus]|uniref:uncharacterized protein LOC125487946 n=1 Tax=Rhincodon typus TaxID=259920 RepID=UPI00202E7136|nr:uncharacterized protein LOC125487946 [Rhincodon typus]